MHGHKVNNECDNSWMKWTLHTHLVNWIELSASCVQLGTSYYMVGCIEFLKWQIVVWYSIMEMILHLTILSGQKNHYVDLKSNFPQFKGYPTIFDDMHNFPMWREIGTEREDDMKLK